uniref:Uncharacterized protein n=1 Tax=Anguilla anguilla TaxID=7936 RepID=A0A0E9VB56_ANGAN
MADLWGGHTSGSQKG